MNSVFEKFVCKQNICPVTTAWGELAWKIKDYALILELFRDNKCIVLGGDVLDLEKNYNYDNWYYNDKSDVSFEENLSSSISVAKEYLQNYIKDNGEKFYVVFVFRSSSKQISVRDTDQE